MSGLPFVISAPSGTGKTTVCRRLVALDGNLRFSISHTTRNKRPQEKAGEDYHFISEEEFEALKSRDEFLEWARYGPNLYGTSLSSLRGMLSLGFDLLLEIEVQGAEQIRKKDVDAKFIFLLPPTLHELEVRLRGRATDTDEVIATRLGQSKFELSKAGLFDYAVVNDDLERAVQQVHEIIEAERCGECAKVKARFGREAVMAEWRKTAG